MKKWTLFLSLYFCLCLLSACGAAPDTADRDMVQEPLQENADGGSDTLYSITCRVVEVGNGNQLLLADTESGAIYVLPGGAANLLMDGDDPGGGDLTVDWAPKAGVLAEVAYDGMILETWPAQFANASAVNIRSDGFDDRCALYLRVLEDLWEVDPGLNSDGVTYIGVDLSQTSLSESERAAVTWAFAQKHGGELVQGTYDELVEQGYITSQPLEGTDAKFWQWEDGCLFSITERDEPVAFSLPSIAPGEEVPAYDAVCFDAQKWRSSLGAYAFSDCTAVRNADGQWGDYTVGSEMVS